MKASRNLRMTLLAAFLQGGAIVAVLVWTALSVVPLVALVYRNLTISEMIWNVIFASTGVLGVGTLYALWLLLASPEARVRFAPDSRKVLHRLGILAAGWIVLFTLFG